MRPARTEVRGAGAGRIGPAVRRLLPVLLVVPVQLVLLAVMRAVVPRFFWLDDSATQFGPMWWWLGRTARDGRPPLMDPDLGSGGAFSLDIQYGALDPFHWILQAFLGRMTDMESMSWVVAAVCTVLVATGVAALARSAGASGWLAVAAGVGAANSGFLLWYGSSWWPMLWSLGWLVWFWFGLTTRSAVGVPIVGVALAGLLGSGNPYIAPFGVLMVVTQLVERRWSYGSWRAVLRSGEVLARAAAGVGGFLLGLPTVATLLQGSSYSARPGPEGLLANNGFAVPNLLDTALGGPTLLGQLNAWNGVITPVPALSTALFAVPLLALVDWRQAIRSRGVLTALAVVVAALLVTQLPSTIANLRVPMRYMVVAQVALPVLAVAGVVAARRITRWRLAVVALLVVAQIALAGSRAPVVWRWHVLGGALLAVAVVAAVVLLVRAGRGRALAGAVLVLACSGTWFVQTAMMERVEAIADSRGIGSTSAEGSPFRSLPSEQPESVTVDAFRERAVLVDDAVTVLKWTTPADRGWADGVLSGNANLLADLRPGFGSIAVGQRFYGAHVCRDYLGALCGSAADPGTGAQLLDIAPGTDRNWLELTSDDMILLAADAPATVRAYLDGAWADDGVTGEWTVYTRDDGLPGRVTWADGVEFGERSETAAAYSGEAMDRYEVSTGPAPASLVLRTVFWPGITATVDGIDAPVSGVDGAVVRIDLPAGVDRGELRVSYAPIGDRILVPVIVLGTALILGGLVLQLGLRARRLRAAAEGADQSRPVSRTRLLIAQFARFFWGSGVGLTVDLGLYALLTSLGTAAWLANGISAAVATVIVYVLVTRYAFGARATLLSFLVFAAWYATSIVVFSLLIEAGVQLLGLHPFLSKILSIPFSFGSNFLFSRLLFTRLTGRSTTRDVVDSNDSPMPTDSQRSAR